jgi:hypothetical protein
VLSVVAGFATEQAAVDSALRLEAIEISALAQTVAPRATLTSDRPHSVAIDNQLRVGAGRVMLLASHRILPRKFHFAGRAGVNAWDAQTGPMD